MKKILMTLALAALAFTANAQWIIGGRIDARHWGDYQEDYNWGNSSTTFDVLPQIGYQLNDQMQIGVQAGLSYNYDRNYRGPMPSVEAKDNYISDYRSIIKIAPYFRYNVAQWKDFTFFLQARLSLNLALESHTYGNAASTTVDNGDNYTGLRFDINPGLNYRLSDKFSMDLNCSVLELFAELRFIDGLSYHDYGFGANAAGIGLTFNYHL